MVLPYSDRQLISVLDYFRQATTSQLRSLVFPEAKSRTSLTRVLNRLARDDYIMQVERRRLIGGGRGGSGEYVWCLGPAGWRICKREGRFRREVAVDYHALTITEIYAHLRRQEREGRLKVVGFTPEPESWVTVDGNELKPDLLVEIGRPNGTGTRVMFIEADMGTQRPARIIEKIERYLRAFESGELDPFPQVVFIAHDDDRAGELAFTISRTTDEEGLFKSTTVEKFPLDM